MYYSGAAQDHLRETIEDRLNSKNDAQKSRDREFARHVSIVRFEVDSVMRGVSVVIKSEENGESKTRVIRGSLNDRRVFQIRLDKIRFTFRS